MRLRLHCDYGNGVLSMPRAGAIAPPRLSRRDHAADAVLAMKSKARSEPLWSVASIRSAAAPARRHRRDLRERVPRYGTCGGIVWCLP
jgi:hypothetical protein